MPTNSSNEPNSSENSNCNYTSTFNGTSSAAPTVAGVIALVLQANPSLTWRQVKHILARTASVDFYSTGSIAHPQQGLGLPTDHVWEQRWVTNGAGFRFHNWYGFGRVNVDDAVAMALASKTTPINLGTYTETNWSHAYTGLSVSIPDPNSDNTVNAMTYETSPITTNLKIEGVQIRVEILHDDISELSLELISPAGTKSILVNGRNALTGIADYEEETFLSNAFYQENAAGKWTLRVVDAKRNGKTGTLTSFKINFVGGE